MTVNTINLYSRLGVSFSCLSNNAAKKGIDPNTNLTNLSLLLIEHIKHYELNDPLHLTEYLAVQEQYIKSSNVFIHTLSEQIEKTLEDDNIVIPDNPVNILEISWSIDNPVLANLLKLFMLADRAFLMLELAKSNNLADGVFIQKKLRGPIINSLKSCFICLLDARLVLSEKYKDGLYSININN